MWSRIASLWIQHLSEAFLLSLFSLIPSHFFPASVQQIYTDWANHYLAKSGHKRLIKDLQQDIADGVLLAEIIQIIGKSCPLRETMRLSAPTPFGKIQFMLNAYELGPCVSEINVALLWFN